MIWYSFASVLVPMLLIPLIASYFPKLKPKRYMAELTKIAGGGIALVAYLIGIIRGNSIKPDYIFGIEPMYVGLIASILVFILGWEITKKQLSSRTDS